MPRLAAYGYGVGSILVGVIVWRGLQGDWQTVLGIAGISAAAGVVTALAYAIDRIAMALHRERLGEEMLNLLPASKRWQQVQQLEDVIALLLTIEEEAYIIRRHAWRQGS